MSASEAEAKRLKAFAAIALTGMPLDAVGARTALSSLLWAALVHAGEAEAYWLTLQREREENSREPRRGLFGEAL